MCNDFASIQAQLITYVEPGKTTAKQRKSN